MIHSIERIATGGVWGDALDRFVSIMTDGVWDSFYYPSSFKPKITELADKRSLREIGDICEIGELANKYSVEVE